MSLSDIPLRTLTNEPTTLAELASRKPALIVNVASRCGLTPQYIGLVKLQEQYGPRGFTVIGMPCNQFAGQEPGTAKEIQHFCSTTYGVDFPLLEKSEVNGPGRHPLYTELIRTPDEQGEAGDVQWNFEKFLVDGQGEVVARFRPRVTPEDPAITSAIERLL
ncbi:glutathione peroxidase [Nonomuraea thailandensis]|uniref:Glutathione peroxidase n=1 Tax=Nonomuraea thailandensis TaxID=1188745 RepID=A0A9X2GGZ2_9ACTN|nr:glutathione peroxidase [Nonomuraea thailandensis]MCP2354483.1 glutathione peroxidase [Nonomuraea thailandensis]